MTKNKRILLVALATLITMGGTVFAATGDRFGNSRDEVPRSSFTLGNESNVVLASAPVILSSETGGMVMLRYVECTGLVPSTITFYNSIVFDGDASTRAVFQYIPNTAVLSQSWGILPFTVLFSSSLSYDKKGLAPCNIGWDYTIPPKWGGVGTDN